MNVLNGLSLSRMSLVRSSDRKFFIMMALMLGATELHAAPPPSSIPDLTIERVALNENCLITVTVRNNGPGPLPDSVWTARSPSSSGVYLTIAGRPWGGGTIWSFDPARALKPAGGRATYVSSYVVTRPTMVQATVDATAQVAESNEANNSTTTRLECIAATSGSGTSLAPAERTGFPAATLPGQRAMNVGTPVATPGATPVTAAPSSGGSLMQGGLPPPPQGAPPSTKDDVSVEPGELVAVTANMVEAQALQQQLQTFGYSVKRRSNLRGLGLVITVVRLPAGVSVGMALAHLRQGFPNLWVDANHRYRTMEAERHFGQRAIHWNAKPGCGRGLRLGLIDGPVETVHPLLKGHSIESRSFLATGIEVASADHGTAIAALLVGDSIGLLPGAQLYAANVFRARGRESDTTAEWVVQALNWLVEKKVSIVNLSLGGVRNLLLEAAIERVQALGVAVVAAGGNGGHDAPPVFPAAQPGVIAVTAVDAELKVWSRANRGDYLSFAAPGVDVWSAAPGRDGVYLSGTSYAAPFVTAALGAERLVRPKASWPALQQQLQKKARDLGSPGRDPIYGWGLVQASSCK